MSAIERVMKAYASKHDLNPEQAMLVRAELSKFVNELRDGRRPPTLFSENARRDASSACRATISGHQTVHGR